ncbi:hypothetical protein GBF38_019859 [Nibea albiflora]|uniref:Uncharacterized protein n=1 Tax=Nibea albiflora TaxID=240163 RepID=A0ACB7F964_NIBAL|nr:hypothetical protein GBF38_019859 [Nibea albiflora]
MESDLEPSRLFLDHLTVKPKKHHMSFFTFSYCTVIEEASSVMRSTNLRQSYYKDCSRMGGVTGCWANSVKRQRAAEHQLAGTRLVGLQVGLDEVCQSLDRMNDIQRMFILSRDGKCLQRCERLAELSN